MLLIATGLTARQQPQVVFLAWIRALLQADGSTKRAAITDAEQRPDALAIHPGQARDQPQLLTKCLLPAGRMNPRCTAEAADGASALVASR